MRLKRTEEYYTSREACIDISREELITAIQEAMNDDDELMDKLGGKSVAEYVDEDIDSEFVEFIEERGLIEFDDYETTTSIDPYEIKYEIEDDD